MGLYSKLEGEFASLLLFNNSLLVFNLPLSCDLVCRKTWPSQAPLAPSRAS